MYNRMPFQYCKSLKYGVNLIQVNLDMTDSVGPGKLVRHMQNPSYAYDGLSPSYASVYLIALGTSVDL